MKTAWRNRKPDKMTKRVMRDDECYAVWFYDVTASRKRLPVMVMHFDILRKQIVLEVLDWWKTDVVKSKRPLDGVTCSLVGSNAAFMLFNMRLIDRVSEKSATLCINLVYKYDEMRKIKVEDKQKLIRRHIDLDDTVF